MEFIMEYMCICCVSVYLNVYLLCICLFECVPVVYLLKVLQLNITLLLSGPAP